MELDQLHIALDAARKLSNHHEFVIAGSLSVLGLNLRPPEFMAMSIDIDFYPLRDPGRAEQIAAELGEGSAFHHRYGYYLDPISPELPILPAEWNLRLVELQLGKICALFLDVNDTAVSKYARGEPHDFRWIEVGIDHQVIDLDVVLARMQFSTRFASTVERQAALSRAHMHQLALENGQLDQSLLKVLHEHGVETQLLDLDTNIGRYTGEVLWTSNRHVVQQAGKGIAIHDAALWGDAPEIGSSLTIQYLDGERTPHWPMPEHVGLTPNSVQQVADRGTYLGVIVAADTNYLYQNIGLETVKHAREQFTAEQLKQISDSTIFRLRYDNGYLQQCEPYRPKSIERDIGR